MKEKERIENALKIAWTCAQISGEEHKMWVIDQMVQVLCGSDDKYADWIKSYETTTMEDEFYTWNTGVKPEAKQ